MAEVTIKFHFDIDDYPDRLHMYSQAEGMFRAVREFDLNLRNVNKYHEDKGHLHEGIEYAREQIREYMDLYGVNLDFLM